mgnify:FL=1
MKTDLEKFQEIVADINTIIFGRPANDAEAMMVKKAKEFLEWNNLALKYRKQYQDTYKDKPKPKRKRGRPKGSKNKVKKSTSKRNKWL